MTDDSYQFGPVLPRAAVSVAVFHEDRVLLVKRGRPPLKGLWSLPGGHIETGEAAVDAVKRELREETAIEAKILGISGVKDFIQQNDRGDVLSHRVILVFYGIWEKGEISAGSDAQDTAWLDADRLDSLDVTEGLLKIIADTKKILRNPFG